MAVADRALRYTAAALCCLVFPSIALCALQQHIRFEHISVEHGLSHSRVTAIVQDSSGYMWIGTQDGLNRYDGYDFTIYRHDPDDPHSISDSEIRSVVEDPFGNLWIGTRSGLNRLNRGAGTFTRFMNDPGNATSIGDNDITALLVDYEAVLWVGTRNGGLNRFDHANQTFDRFQYDPSNLPDSIAQGPIAAIYEDRNDDLWVATRAHNHGALDQFDRTTDTFVHTYGCPDEHHGDCNIQQTGDERRPIATDINGLFQDSTGAFWMATDSGAIQEFEGWLSQYTTIADDVRSISDWQVIAPLEDRIGTLWFGTRRGGLNRMGPSKPASWTNFDGFQRYQLPDDPAWRSVFDRYQHDANDPHSLNSDLLTVLYEDRFGVIWIGTHDAGLNKFDPASMRFGFYKHEPALADSLSDNKVSSIANDNNQNLWLGTLDGNLNRIDRSTGQLRKYRHQSDNPHSLPGASIHALFVDREEVLWIGTAAGLSHYDSGTDQFDNINLHPIGPSALGVLSITEGPVGTLWLGTTASLTRFDIASGDIRHYWPDRADETALHGDRVHDVSVDSEGRIWAATDTAGVNVFDPLAETFTHYRHIRVDSNSISDDYVTTILDEGSGSSTGSGPVIWFGTRNGLDRYDKTTQSITRFDSSDGLPGNHITGMTHRGRYLWITTDASGISRYDATSNSFSNFDVIDGLQGNQFFERAIRATANGEIIVSGYHGINAFNPEQVTENRASPSVVFTDFRVANNPVEMSEAGEILTINDSKGEFSVRFASLDFANPSRTEYAYILDGFDSDWTVTDAANRLASYQDLGPGNYTFRVRSRLGNGEWGENSSSLTLSIPSPVWQTNWAYASYVLLLMLSVYLVTNMRATTLRRQAQQLEAKVAERTRQIDQNERLIQHQADHLEELLHMKEKLFTNISHEFRTPLTLILGPIERMLRKASDSESTSQLSMVKENSQRLLRLVDQLLGLSRLSAEEPVTRSPQPLLPLATTIVESFQPLAEEKRIQLDIVNGEGLWVSCAPDALEKILLNLISNAIKYTADGGWVSVRIASVDSDVVRLSVSDSGIGIDPKDHAAVFERFYRANGNGNGGGATPGAGLGLALVKELAEAFGGSVELESRPGLGTTISVLLPRHRARPAGHEVDTDAFNSGLIPLEIAVSGQSQKLASVSTPDKSNGKASLLIVEDNTDMQRYLISLFEDDYECQIAGDGEEGIRLATEHIPDAVICDVMLPNMDGFDVSKTLKKSEATSHIPIIMLTGRGDHDSRLKGLREHVDDYLTKPFDDEELTLRIDNLLNARDALKRRYSRQLFDGSDARADLGPREQRFLDKLQEVLEEHYFDAEFRVEQLAAALAMSDRQLQRKLKALVDHSPAEYLRTYRLTMAKKRLGEGVQVGLVSESVGFSSQAYFASCFKAEFGTTPTEFQNGGN
jgi:signal transduction histidine kinase/ligand-binding sensor domain-containing protein/DNA-binding response OmpR family regulator